MAQRKVGVIELARQQSHCLVVDLLLCGCNRQRDPLVNEGQWQVSGSGGWLGIGLADEMSSS